MTMREVPENGTQLDRMDAKLDLVLDRVTRIEEQVQAQGGKLHAHAVRLDEHSGRIRDIEISHAVSVATSKDKQQTADGRWGALGATGLVILSGIGAFLGGLAINYLVIS